MNLNTALLVSSRRIPSTALFTLMVHLYWCNSDVASRWVHRESNLLFTLSSDKDQRKIRFRFPSNIKELIVSTNIGKTLHTPIPFINEVQSACE